jgi:hypothetical protein
VERDTDQMKPTLVIVVMLSLASAATADAARIHVSWYSQQYGPASAAMGAEIAVQKKQPHPAASASGSTASAAVHLHKSPPPKEIGGAYVPLPPAVYPPLSANSTLLQNSTPGGQGSFWYQDGSGHVCEYVPDASALCFTITGTGNAGSVVAPLAPATIAEHTADRLTLTPGELKANPSGTGLAGAASWFWLDPAPTTQRLSVRLAGEDVTVTAVPQVDWQFGDGSTLDGGPGVPYASGSAPAGAVTHVYDTRCLPGDQGRNPYVLSSCGSDGYSVAAEVNWQIRYQAEGSVTATGDLPTRTTNSSAAYPVSEARAFLNGGIAQ